jgi:DNA-binding response OmpR family regulator
MVIPGAKVMLRRILVIDDDHDIRAMLQDRLQAMGFVVVTAGDGYVGMEIVKSSWIDGILLDIEMPVVDGLSTLQELRRWHAHIPVIMMSAENDPEKLKTAMELGALGYAPKPIDGARLGQQCKHLFG